MDWQIVAIVVETAAVMCLVAALMLVVGVLGGQWKLRRDIIEAVDEAHRANERITREIKTRAGRDGQEARHEAKSLEAQAAEALALAATSQAAPGLPSTISLINGGPG